MKSRRALAILALFVSLFLGVSFSNGNVSAGSWMGVQDCIERAYKGHANTNLEIVIDSCEWVQQQIDNGLIEHNPTSNYVNNSLDDVYRNGIQLERFGESSVETIYVRNLAYSTNKVTYNDFDYFYDNIRAYGSDYVILDPIGRWDPFVGDHEAFEWRDPSTPITGKFYLQQFIDSGNYVKSYNKDGSVTYKSSFYLYFCLNTSKPLSGYPQCVYREVPINLVIKYPDLVLTGIAVDKSGREIDRNIIPIVTDVVKYERNVGPNDSNLATITSRSVEGYTFLGWKRNKNDDGFISTDASYSEHLLEKNVTVYAVYEEEVIVEDEENTLLEILVKNDKIKKNIATGANYSYYQAGPVFAKPTDRVRYEAIYNPILQYAFTLRPDEMMVTCFLKDEAVRSKREINSNNLTFGELFERHKRDCDPGQSFSWNNSFAIKKGRFDHQDSLQETWNGINDEYFRMNNGDTTRREFEYPKNNFYTVKSSDVGKKLRATTQTNVPMGLGSDIRYTPTQIIFTESGGRNVGNLILSNIQKSAEVVVPYNFTIGVKINSTYVGGDKDQDKDGNIIVSAGSEFSVDFTVSSNDRRNKVTMQQNDKNYHTRIDNPQVRTVGFFLPEGVSTEIGDVVLNSEDDICSYIRGSVGNNSITCDIENANADSYIENKQDFKRQINVPDAPAGSHICVAVAAYPNSSNKTRASNDDMFYGDTTIDPSGDGKWKISVPVCYLVGKKPTFQVWGGSIYTYNGATTGTTVKHNLADDSKVLAINSWVEHSVVSGSALSSKVVTGIASGASTGLLNKNITYSDNSGKVKAGSIEGRYDFRYCTYRIPLSIANSNYNTGVDGICPSGEATGRSGIIAKTPDVEYIISALDAYAKNHPADDVEERPLGDVKVKIKKEGFAINLDSSPEECSMNGIVRNCVWKSDGDITIESNISYNWDGEANNITGIPKVIVYANNIRINCTVDKIDAILIAKNDIYTCNGASDDNINEAWRSRLLRITGAVSAGGTIEFERTYGTSVGFASAIPAEIINYDSTIVLWWRNVLLNTGHNGFTTVYQKELAPRY